MRYVEHEVPAALRGCVRAVWHLTGDGRHAVPSPIAPDGCVEIVFNVGDSMREHIDSVSRLQPHAMIVGQMLRPITVAPTGRIDLWGIRLQPWAVHHVLDVKARELRDLIVPLDLLGVTTRNALGWVTVADDSATRLTALTRAVYELTGRSRMVPSIASALVRRVEAAQDATSVRMIARSAGVSVRRVEALFDVHVGLAPKSLLRLSRFQRALALLRSPDPMRMGRIAAQCGYHDHAHFVRECRQFAGAVPSVAAGQPEHMGDMFIEGLLPMSG